MMRGLWVESDRSQGKAECVCHLGTCLWLGCHSSIQYLLSKLGQVSASHGIWERTMSMSQRHCSGPTLEKAEWFEDDEQAHITEEKEQRSGALTEAPRKFLGIRVQGPLLPLPQVSLCSLRLRPTYYLTPSRRQLADSWQSFSSSVHAGDRMHISSFLDFFMSELKDILTPVPLTFLNMSAEWEERREEESP